MKWTTMWVLTHLYNKCGNISLWDICFVVNVQKWYNGDIHNMFVIWMRNNNTTNWATGIQFVQCQSNRPDHVRIKRSPYEAMFGCAPEVGLSTTLIPNEIVMLTLQRIIIQMIFLYLCEYECTICNSWTLYKIKLKCLVKHF